MKDLPARPSAFDEMRDGENRIRSHYQAFERWHNEQSDEAMSVRRLEADLSFRRVGITFSVAGDAAGTERLIPFDLIPRIIPAEEWRTVDAWIAARERTGSDYWLQERLRFRQSNGQVKDLSNNRWSDVNFIRPGGFGAVAGLNTLVVFDVAGNSETYTFTLN